jgi:hypothetical protein
LYIKFITGGYYRGIMSWLGHLGWIDNIFNYVYKMAKIKPLFMLVLGLVVVLLFLVVASWQDYLPYDNEKQNYANYEPFGDSSDNKIESVLKATPSPASASASATSAPATKPPVSPASVIQNVLSGVMPSSSAENFEPLVEQPQTVQYGPFRDSEIIDKFSQVTANGQDGVDGCVSSGLSNAGGYICLTPELIQLLKTRGGNAAGGEPLSKK